MIKKFRALPLEKEGVLWDGNNLAEVLSFVEGKECSGEEKMGKNFRILDEHLWEGGLILKTLNGESPTRVGYYILKGVNNEFYPCNPDILELSYEEIIA